MRAAWRWSLATLGGFALLVLGYIFAGLVGGAVPVNRDWREPADGIRVHIEDNGIHTGIIVPKDAAGIRFDDLVRPEDLADPRYAGHAWLSFGWGDRAFYVGTPTWAELDIGTVVAAATGSDDTVLHVGHLGDPTGEPGVRSITLTVDQYRRLARFIRTSFAVRRTVLPGYGVSDSFYAARGRYSAVRTCNAWTGAALRTAGVPMGAWTPFPVTVMGWL